jgi:putative transposase
VHVKRRLPYREVATLFAPAAVNNTWSFDFMSDTTWSGTRFRVLNLIDEGVSEALDLVVDNSITAKRVVRTLQQRKAGRGPHLPIGPDQLITVYMVKKNIDKGCL